jgi:hypothetical protein
VAAKMVLGVCGFAESTAATAIMTRSVHGQHQKYRCSSDWELVRGMLLHCGLSLMQIPMLY